MISAEFTDHLTPASQEHACMFCQKRFDIFLNLYKN